jgi:molybdopterin converting factor small subunit
MCGFFRQKKETIVTFKFFSGIHLALNLEQYDLGKGITVKIKEGEQIKKILKRLGVPGISSCVYFINGVQGGLGTSLKEGDVISCFRPSAGG